MEYVGTLFLNVDYIAKTHYIKGLSRHNGAPYGLPPLFHVPLTPFAFAMFFAQQKKLLRGDGLNRWPLL